MKWVLLNRNNIFNAETGSVIELLEGTWDHPIEIQLHSADEVDPIQEVRELRQGVKAAKARAKLQQAS